MKVVVPFAEGFEEIEGITIVDVLRRAGIDVTTAYINTNPVTGSHDIPVSADASIKDIGPDGFDCIALPGGMPGSSNLKEAAPVISMINRIYDAGGYVAALCAAPIVLGHAGVLEGITATCYPGFEGQMTGARYLPEPVVQDGRIITGRGPGCAIPFALKLVEVLLNRETASQLKEAMQVYWM